MLWSENAKAVFNEIAKYLYDFCWSKCHYLDLSRVQRKLDDLEYHRLQDFIYDIGKIFDNARLFNPKDSPISQCADILEKRFRENLQSVKEEMNIKQRGEHTTSFSESAGGGDDNFLDEEAIDVDYWL